MIPQAKIVAFFAQHTMKLAAALLIVVLLSLVYCTGRKDGKSGEVIEQQEREIETQAELGKANDGAAETRVEDAVEAVKQEKELNDAIKATQNPDRQRALRGCVIMRQQGRDTSGIPACH